MTRQKLMWQISNLLELKKSRAVEEYSHEKLKHVHQRFTMAKRNC